MKDRSVEFKENFPDYLCVKHKIAEHTEKQTFHLHSQLEIIFTISDNLICFYENAVIRIPKYSFLLLNTMCLHYVDSLPNSGVCDRYVITFSSEFLKDIQSSGVNLLGCFLEPEASHILLTPPSESVPWILHLLDAMETETMHSSFHALSDNIDERFSTLTLKYQLASLLTELNRLYLSHFQVASSLKHQRYSSLVSDVCSYIEQNVENEISIEDLARRFAVSKTFLYNITREFLNLPLSDYISMVRINKAKSYLANTDYSIEIISQKVGYSSISSFSRFFKNNVGMSPLKYRKITET